MRPSTPTGGFSRHAGPSSPPETPTSPTFTFGNGTRSARRQGVYNFSRPIPRAKGGIDPVGDGPNFRYNPSVRPEDISPRSSSSPSSDSSRSPPRSLSSKPEEPDHLPPWTPTKQVRIVAEGDFTIEELRDGDMQPDSDDNLSVVHPDGYEDAESDAPPSKSPISATDDLDARMLADDLGRLNCNHHSDEREAWVKERRKQKKKKRWSLSSLHKRTLSQSIGSDTDDEDLQLVDANEAGSSARRLRRKTGDRTSLIFDDPPQRIIELDEPESNDDVARLQLPEPDVAVDADLMSQFPYYDEESDGMDVDYDHYERIMRFYENMDRNTR